MKKMLSLLASVLVLALFGCAPSGKMHSVDSIGRRILKVEEVALALSGATGDSQSEEEDAGTAVAQVSTPEIDKETLGKATKVILYECQEILSWVRPLRKDVGAVPEKKRLELDSVEERDTRFEYSVVAGAKASKRARKKQRWDGLLSIPRKMLEWTIKTVWKVVPWWIKLPVFAVLAVWLYTTLYVYYAKTKTARAAVQGEAVIARLQKHVEEQIFVDAVDPGRNPDLARVHERQKRTAAKVARMKSGGTSRG